MQSKFNHISRRGLLSMVTVGLSTATINACSDDSHTSGSQAGSSGGNAADPDLNPAQQVMRDAKYLEPESFAQTFTVDATGAHGAYRTIKDAFAAVSAAKGKALGQDSFIQAQSVPWLWHRVEVKPGSYREAIAVPPHTALVGLGDKPEEVHIHWDGDANVVESTGRSLYVKNVMFEHTSDDPMTHPMRESGPSGDVGLQKAQRRSVVFDSVRFRSAPSAPLGKCTNDMTAYGVEMAFINCVFDGPGQPQSLNLVTDAAPELGGAIRASFIGCHIISNHAQHADVKAGVQPGPAAPFGCPDSGKGRPDSVLWMNGTWDVTKVYGVQGLIVLPLVGLDGKRQDVKQGTKYYLVNPGAVKGIDTIHADPKVDISGSVPRGYRLPVHTLGSGERAFFGRKPRVRTERIAVGGASSGTMSVKAGDTFWVRTTLSEQTISSEAIEVGSLSEGSIAGAIALEDQGAPIQNPNGQTSGSSAGSRPTLASFARRWFFPGQGAIWVGVAFTHDAQVPCIKAAGGQARKGSAYTSGQLTVSTTTLLPAGTAVPAVAILSDLPQGFPS